MSLETVPYVISADLHSAQLFRQTLQNLWSGTGVVGVGGLEVTPHEPTNLSVNIAAGNVIVPGTQGSTTGQLVNAGSQHSTYSSLPADFTTQGVYNAIAPAVTNLTLTEANAEHARLDLICASVQDAQYSGSFNQALLQVVTGTPSGSPVAPTPPNNTVVLAQVEVKAKATKIEAANITDRRLLAGTSVATSIIPTEQSRENVGYGTLATPDEVTVTVPENGLLMVTFFALWQCSVSEGARAAIFIGTNQLKVRSGPLGTPVVEAARQAVNASVYAPLVSFGAGLAQGSVNAANGYSGDVATGVAFGDANGLAWEHGETAATSEAGQGGVCAIRSLTSGTYKITIQYKSPSGKVTAKNRSLLATVLS
jgi:hypothetical protein